jgi:hypothetical protein
MSERVRVHPRVARQRFVGNGDGDGDGDGRSARPGSTEKVFPHIFQNTRRKKKPASCEAGEWTVDPKTGS